MNDRRLHQLFEIGILMKGAHAVIECIGGLMLALIGTQTITSLVQALTQDELIEDRADYIANTLLHFAQTFSVSTQHFYAFYLLSHGIVKLALVAGLLAGRLWAYPAALAAMGLFIAYQLYRYSYTHGIGLIVLTVFDLAVIWLIWREYRVVRAAAARQGAG
ncbi:MAG: DUF2127 domain-containing protein [Proteobacteria bacterium]|nr:DUF2127 domain-containing protein [Pseudomonadota bacterium]MBS0573596.1 DUF2127 domain-containing protein [Pseudomonadota bacterium]